MNLYLKWAIVVGLNALVGLFLGYKSSNSIYLTGMFTGIFTWFLIYSVFDKYLINTGRNEASRKLFLAALFRIPLQFTIIPDLYAGMLSLATLNLIGGNVALNGFVSSYFTTILTGLFLSVMCSVLYLIISGVEEVKKIRNNA